MFNSKTNLKTSMVIDVPINIGWFGSKPSEQINSKVADKYSDYKIVNIVPNSRNAFKDVSYYIVGLLTLGFYQRTPGFLVILEHTGQDQLNQTTPDKASE